MVLNLHDFVGIAWVAKLEFLWRNAFVIFLQNSIDQFMIVLSNSCKYNICYDLFICWIFECEHFFLLLKIKPVFGISFYLNNINNRQTILVCYLYKYIYLFIAQESGKFDAEMITMTIKSRKGPKEVKVDEHPRPGVTMEQLAKLPPVFKKDGTVSAGNASVRATI